MKAKTTWRFIPQKIYQTIAILLLVACVALTIEMIWRRDGLFLWLLERLGETRWGLAAVLTFLILFVGWVLIMLLLRVFSQLPTFQEELEAAGAKNFAELYEQQREKVILGEDEAVTPEQKLARSRGLAMGGLVLFVIAGLATAVIYLVSNILWISGLVIALVGIILGSWHGLKSLHLLRHQ